MKSIYLTMAVFLMAGCNDPLLANVSGPSILVDRGSTKEYNARIALVKAVIGEAEGEPQEGKEAVACALHNRGTLAGVYGLRAPRVRKHLYSKSTWEDAVVAVWMADNHDYCDSIIHGAQFWEGTRFPTPYWAKSMQLTAVIGHQRFYRKD
jgi:hypothetical protein